MIPRRCKDQTPWRPSLHTPVPPCFWHRRCGFLETRCSKDPGSSLTTGFLSPFYILPKVSHANVHWAIAHHTFSCSQKPTSSHFLAIHKPPLSQHSDAWVRNPHGISKLVNKVDCPLSYDSSWTIPKRSLHLITLQWVPHASLNKKVWVFLATKSFAAGSSTYPCQMACVSKSEPRDIISSSSCCPQWPEALWILGVLEVCAHDATSERSILEETLEETFCGTPQAQ